MLLFNIGLLLPADKPNKTMKKADFTASFFYFLKVTSATKLFFAMK